MKNILLVLAVLSFSSSLIAQSASKQSFEGVWVSVDDVSNQRKSEISLYVEGGKLYGQIARLLLEEDRANSVRPVKET